MSDKLFPDPPYTRLEFMDYMKVSNATFWSWAKQEKIKITKVCGSVRVLTNLNELVERGRDYTKNPGAVKGGQNSKLSREDRKARAAAEKAKILEGCDL